jgi:hypothetical protein
VRENACGILDAIIEEEQSAMVARLVYLEDPG